MILKARFHNLEVAVTEKGRCDSGQVFSLDETRLSGNRCRVEYLSHLRKKTVPWFKDTEFWCTVLLGVNADSNFKMKLLVCSDSLPR
jgi:hypothetical protein